MCHFIEKERKRSCFLCWLQRFRSTTSLPDPPVGFLSSRRSTVAAEPSPLPSSRGWGCTPAIKARTSRPLLKCHVGMCLPVCKCKHTCSMSVRPVAWAHHENVSPDMVSRRQRLFVSQMQSWGAVTWFYKRPTWQGPAMGWCGACAGRGGFGRGRLITSPLCQEKAAGMGSLSRVCSRTDSQRRSHRTLQEPLMSASPGCSQVKTPLVFPAYLGKWSVAGIYKRHS